jgi:UDP-N-acetylmuramoyl-L-alanyl-D-glutamate--2,6-diaminopimelate ligase
MGAAVESLSDRMIITSDNPRSEDPEKILSDIEKGMRGQAYTKIVDREEAISLAIEIARDGDIILIAGKGHEDYQIFADRTIQFDDVKVATRFLREKKIAEE